MTGMDRRHTCHICGFRATLQWIEHLAEIALLGIPAGHKLSAVIVRCEECPQLPAPTVIHYAFIPGRDFWT